MIGQTPPPYNGQSLMIEALVRKPMPGVERRHVRMSYSSAMEDMGRVHGRKILHLFTVIGRALWEIAWFRPDLVYYPPAGPKLVPVIRDVVTLLAIRPFCRAIVFHFEAGGISELWPRGLRSSLLVRLFRRAFFHPDGAVMLAPSNPPDGRVLEARRVHYVPNGIDDLGDRIAELRNACDRDRPRVLFVGVMLESKGVLVLARAAKRLWEQGLEFDLVFVGSSTPEIARSVRETCEPFGASLRLTGVLTGDAKWRQYACAEVFCFPTYFESEAMPVVCLEAMMSGLPVVSTRWRGVPDVVVDGQTGVLVEPRDEAACADALERLLRDRDLAARMGHSGRERFLAEFNMDRYLGRMRSVFVEVATADAPRSP